MILFKKVDNLQIYLNQNFSHKNIGFVPTMGALHHGHLSLIAQAQAENDIVVISIFVNPTQFNNEQDLLKYPKTLDADLKLLEQQGKFIVFAPTAEEMYPNGQISSKFDFDGLEHEMEGKFRPGHFDGVGTVVKRLFEIVNPTRAYFGEKDFQQLQIIKKMVDSLNLDIKIISCPIFRETSGLALSSRNKRLTELQKKEATLLYKSLMYVKDNRNKISVEGLNSYVKTIFDKNDHLNLEYFIIADEATLLPVNQLKNGKLYRAFLAVFADQVRLIDNMAL